MSNTPLIVEVVLPSHSLGAEGFSYHAPEEPVSLGMLVEVPYRTGKTKGLVVGIHEEHTTRTLKTITKILHPDPLLSPLEITLAKELAQYYFAPLDRAIKLFLPQEIWENPSPLSPNIHYYCPLLPSTKELTKREKELYALFPKEELISPELLHSLGCSHRMEKSMREKGYLIPEEHSPTHTFTLKNPLPPLTPAQDLLLQQLLKEPKKQYLLHGVTGSGKTLIYLHLAYHTLTQGKQVALLVPEIALTPQLLSTFQKYFGEAIAVVHAHLTPRERRSLWWETKRKEISILLGSRLVLTFPFGDIGCIIIDEEHEWSYKSEQSPRYHAKYLAERIHKHTGATLLLGSATPNIETYAEAKEGIYTLLPLKEKFYSQE